MLIDKDDADPDAEELEEVVTDAIDSTEVE
jgi:hypothetical protein